MADKKRTGRHHITLQAALDKKLEAEETKTGLSPQVIIQAALADYLNQKETQRVIFGNGLAKLEVVPNA